jgi:hypothetical protein
MEQLILYNTFIPKNITQRTQRNEEHKVVIKFSFSFVSFVKLSAFVRNIGSKVLFVPKYESF